MNQSILFAEDSPVRICPSRAAARAFAASVRASGGSSIESLTNFAPAGASSKTSPVSCRATEAGTWEPSSGRWGTWGMGTPTECWTLKGSALPNDARVFIVGCLGDAARAAEVLLEPEGVRGDLAARGETAKEVARTLGGGFGARGNDLDGHGALIPFDIVTHAITADPICANEARTYCQADNNPRPRNVVAVALRGREDGARLEIGGDLGNALRSSQGGGDKAMVAYQCQGSNVGEMGTLRAGNGGLTGGVPFVGVRRLTPIECERLQGFPDGWTEGKGQSDSARYRQIGNAVAVNVARWIGRRIMAADSGGSARLCRE